MEELIEALKKKFDDNILDKIVVSILEIPSMDKRLEAVEKNLKEIKVCRRWWNSQIFQTGFTVVGIVAAAWILNKMGFK